MRLIKFNTRWAGLVLACLFLACSAGNGRSGQPGQPAGTPKSAPGVAVTTKSFPAHTLGDVLE